ncbi:carboxypeptidase regulatory-like domain-containing protein [Ammoniphilus sp. CFH 90114]|uniref:carboxypeptidase regulatory-like domain-containing protein n=1 Tax=Ammoniphilus sp. CFH 90114 TaxID=2493665 RepID=UPI0013E91A9F|nr:carboxypeptidase regulatory-like domain-containing protein [Ammoniphilus sp. CFH 90114]
MSITPEEGKIRLANSHNQPIPIEISPYRFTVVASETVTGSVYLPSTHHLKNLSQFSVKMYHENGSLVGETTTNEKGQYNLRAPMNGSYTVEAWREGYKKAQASVNTKETKVAPGMVVYVGDFNEDDKINTEDIVKIARSFEKSPLNELSIFDVDANGQIDLYDVVAVARNFLK